MRHDKIARASLAIAAALLMSPAAFAAGAGPGSSGNQPTAADAAPALIEAGARNFEKRCAQCHDPKDFTRWARARPDRQVLGKWLSDVLASHMTPPADEGEAIIEYILASAAGEGV